VVVAQGFSFRSWNRQLEWEKSLAKYDDVLLSLKMYEIDFELYLQERKEAHAEYMSNKIQNNKLHNMGMMQ